MNSLGSKNSLGNLLAHWLSCVCFALNILGRKANLISELWGTPERQTEIQFSICPGAAQEERKQPGLHIQVVMRPCVHRPLPLLRVECEDAGGRLGSVGANCTHLGLRPEWKRKDDRVLFLDACSRLVLKIKNPSESGGSLGRSSWSTATCVCCPVSTWTVRFFITTFQAESDKGGAGSRPLSGSSHPPVPLVPSFPLS